MFYSIGKLLARIFLHVYHRVQVEGMEKIPTDGPMIVVGNHVSYLDPFYIGAMLKRRIHFMARQESFENPVTRAILYKLGAFPVNRAKPEVQTMRTALKYLQEGEAVGIFPEGGIKEDHSMQELKQGAAYLAIKANCPVVPIYVDGTLEALPDGRIWISPDKIRLKVGNLVYPPTTGSIREKQSQLSEEMQRELLSLKQFMESSKHKK